MENKQDNFNSFDEWLAANPLYQWRVAKGIDGVALPMRDAGDQLGVSYNSINLWEKGEFMPKYQHFIKMADVMQYDGGAEHLYKVWQAWCSTRPAETAVEPAVV